VAFTWRNRHVEVPLGGHFNVMNALAALTCASVLGIDDDVAVAALAETPPVPGRFEVVTPSAHPFTVVVDYAHTPDGIVEVLTAARSIVPDGRVIIVFGCGGDRDVDKRPLMGAAASEHADLVVVTSDNPRHEDPQVIVDAALSGIAITERERIHVEVDRRAAIGYAIAAAHPGDIIVVAGKGHETTQTIGETVLPFDDRVVARELLAGAAVPPDPPGAPS
jgi:UDP-N-acetylmuramoyl-L-alanyl-D-glutamate--2,6-diaminopimelate ligase